MYAYYFFLGETPTSNGKRVLQMISVTKSRPHNTGKLWHAVKDLVAHSGHHKPTATLYEDDQRHNFSDDFSKVTLATWANLALQLSGQGFGPIDSFSIVAYNLNAYVIDFEGAGAGGIGGGMAGMDQMGMPSMEELMQAFDAEEVEGLR